MHRMLIIMGSICAFSAAIVTTSCEREQKSSQKTPGPEKSPGTNETTLAPAKGNELPCSNEGQGWQGWSEQCRQWFYHVDQGSQFVPYKWFLALEQPDNEKPFRENEIFERFKYLADVRSDNPDSLPVGFSKSNDPQDGEWLGLTCAACHTGEVELTGGKKLRIDGGPAMANLMSFAQFLFRSFEATLSDSAKFTRFAKQVLGEQHNAEEETALRKALENRAGILKAQAGLVEHSGNYTQPDPSMLYGFGRLDAIGLLTNQVIGVKLGLHADERPPDAPVSYPSLWDVSKFNKLQWNGSATHSTARNIGEALGVFAHFIPPGSFKGDRDQVGLPFSSSVQTENLKSMWRLIGVLRSPPWPKEILGELDLGKVDKGKHLYDQKCRECHSLVTDETKDGLVKIQDVNTDEKMATNFECRTAMTSADDILAEFPKEFGDFGTAEGLFKTVIASLTELIAKDKRDPLCPPSQPEEGIHPARHLVATIGVGVTLRQVGLLNVGMTVLEELGKALEQAVRDRLTPRPPEAPSRLKAYRAGPLNGIWATAPYLHNGSVPNLEQLLLPGEQRMKKFCVGSRKFDPKSVGFEVGDGQQCEGTSVFDTTKPGNLNTGHEYGIDLSPEDRAALIEFLKSL